MLITSLSVLTACAGSTRSNNNLQGVLTPAPAELVVPCASPITLPERELTQAEVERYWLKDRKNLVICKRQKDGVVKYYEKRDKIIQGKDLK